MSRKRKKKAGLGRTLAVRSVVVAIALVVAALFGSQIRVACERTDGRVDCAATQGFEVPWTSQWLPLRTQRVENLSDVRWKRLDARRQVGGGARTFVQGGDTLILTGANEIEVGWREAASPIESFLRAGSRREMEVVQPQDARGWLVSRALLAFVALVLLDTLILAMWGQERIHALVGKPPDPDEPLPDTRLARFGQAAVMLAGLALLAFFAVGHRWFGPFAEQKVSALHEAARAGDLAALDAALASGVRVDVVDPATGRTALHQAAFVESSAPLLRLLEAGANPDAYDFSSETPLMVAARRCEAAGVSALLARGADPEATDESGSTPLGEAASAGRAEIVELLLAAGADPRRATPTGWTPLHGAATSGSAAVARLLLDAGADPEARNENGHAPWDVAGLGDAREVIPQPAAPGP